MISIVSPVYGCKTMLAELYLRVKATLEQMNQDFELILVNDNSPDGAWETITELARKDVRVKAVNLSRNFGQHYAITAGLTYAKGEWIIVLDCDLQDQPEEIPRLYQKALEGWDIVYARRVERQDKPLKRLSSITFHLVYDYLSGLKTDASIANFGIYSHKVIREYNKMKDAARAFGSLLSYLGFKICAIDVKHAKRAEGKSSYSLTKLLKLSLDVILSNSNKPLRLTVKFGFLLSFLSFALAIYNIFARFFGIIKVEGFTTTIFSIWFVGGLILFVLGIVGLYIGKIFDQVKERQLFIVSDEINIE